MKDFVFFILLLPSYAISIMLYRYILILFNNQTLLEDKIEAYEKELVDDDGWIWLDIDIEEE